MEFARKAGGVALLAAGVLGIVLPVIPGIPLLIAGAAVLGAEHPLVRPWREWLSKKGIWR